MTSTQSRISQFCRQAITTIASERSEMTSFPWALRSFPSRPKSFTLVMFCFILQMALCPPFFQSSAWHSREQYFVVHLEHFLSVPIGGWKHRAQQVPFTPAAPCKFMGFPVSTLAPAAFTNLLRKFSTRFATSKRTLRFFEEFLAAATRSSMALSVTPPVPSIRSATAARVCLRLVTDSIIPIIRSKSSATCSSLLEMSPKSVVALNI
mmetsp:Transcript_21551/g.44240  ORF Transcript_21551/g.44240 Transcript_21551/m.44240 type:complete len:208 (-) Transcript_21551:173-796(-)